MENEKNIWEVGTPFEDHHQIPRHVAKVILDNADANSVFRFRWIRSTIGFLTIGTIWTKTTQSGMTHRSVAEMSHSPTK